MSRFCSAWLAVLLFVSFARGQALVERVPEDAILYVGWAGTETAGLGYDESHLKAVLDETRVDQLFSDFLPRVLQKIGEKEPQAAEIADTIAALSGALVKHPTAIYFGGVEGDIDGEATIKLAIFCDAKGDAPAILDRINALLDKAADQDKLNIIAASDEKGVITIRPQRFDVPETSIKDSPEFREAFSSLHAAPVLATYLSVSRLSAMVELLMEQGKPESLPKYKKAMTAFGFDGLRQIACTGGFVGKKWEMQSLIDAPAPRRGLLTALDTVPASDDLLKMVPQSATFVKTGTLDLANLLREFKTALSATDPEVGKQFGQILGAATMMIGKRVDEDVLEPLGNQWVTYASPDIAGNGILGMVVVNKLDDPAKAAVNLKTAVIALNNVGKGAMRNADFKFEGRMVNIGGVDVYYAGVPYLAPAWAIQDGYLYVGLFPQSVASAARYAKSGGPSILKNEAFLAMRQNLNGKNASGISFNDLPQLAGTSSGYATMLVIARLGLGLSDIMGVPAPEPIVPPLDVLKQHLSPCGSVSWSDEKGLHTRSITPFPGASFLSEQGLLTAGGIPTTGLMVSILLPSLNRARETANRVKCASNMRQIGQAILLYSNENRGKYPDDLGMLITTQDIGVEVFTCPSGNVTPPAKRDDLDAMTAWVNENSPYVYRGKGMTSSELPDTVVLYEKAEDHDEDGMNMLLGDGHVEFVQMERAMEMIPQLREGF